MANRVDPDQTALGAVWSGATLFGQFCLSERYGYSFSLIHIPDFNTF